MFVKFLFRPFSSIRLRIDKISSKNQGTRKKVKKPKGLCKIFISNRSSHPEVFLLKGVLKICSKFTGEHPCRSIIEITLPHGCSPVNLLHIFRKPFTKNTSERLLLIKQKYIYLAIRAPFHTHFHVSIFYFSFNIVDSKVFLRHLFLLFCFFLLLNAPF